MPTSQKIVRVNKQRDKQMKVTHIIKERSQGEEAGGEEFV
jgi:hypothetical protein